MILSIWKIYQTEVDTYFKVITKEKLNRINLQKKEVLNIVGKAIEVAQEAIKEKDKIRMTEIRFREIKEAREKLAEAIALLTKQDPNDSFLRKYEKAAENLNKIEPKLIAQFHHGPRAPLIYLNIAQRLADPDTGDLEQAIQKYKEAIEKIKEFKNLDRKNRRAYIQAGQTGLVKNKKILERLQTLTLIYKNIISKPASEIQSNDLQLAYETLIKLKTNKWFVYWNDKLRLKNEPLQGFHWIDSLPSQAALYINEEFIGETPLLYVFSLEKRYSIYQVKKKGFIPHSLTIPEDSPWKILIKLQQ